LDSEKASEFGAKNWRKKKEERSVTKRKRVTKYGLIQAGFELPFEAMEKDCEFVNCLERERLGIRGWSGIGWVKGIKGGGL
jgi:hypothetical protein